MRKPHRRRSVLNTSPCTPKRHLPMKHMTSEANSASRRPGESLARRLFSSHATILKVRRMRPMAASWARRSSSR